MPNAKHAALITGSNKNIGRACALILAKAGCNIVVNGSKDRRAADSVVKEIEVLGTNAIVAMGDVGRRDDCMAIADTALKAFGTIDILVNNVAIREDGEFLEMTEDAWRYAMAVNFDAAYWLSRRCLPGMVAQKWGRIVNFAGMNAIHGYNGRAHVSASKHAAWGQGARKGVRSGRDHRQHRLSGADYGRGARPSRDCPHHADGGACPGRPTRHAG
jgi:3-oxoacyl-[acyl-carrier protein] reductase